MSMGTRNSGADGELTEDVIETMSVQERGGTLQISIPKSSAKDLALEKGDTALVSGESGGRSLTVRKASADLLTDE